ncbi:MAG TPA: phosphotransferase family protein [Acidimicrobiales bacterium]|nr:phosphotransferase family protein [Acidimicrobiales bacterium]
MPATPIDTAELQARANELLDGVAPGCGVGPITPLQGGTSSITYWTSFSPPGADRQKVVLKVAPAGLDPVRNRDVLRQARVLRALAPTTVPVPRVFAEHAGAPPEVPPFFVMSYEDGDCIEPNFLAPEQQLPAGQVRERELHAARVLGELHALDPAAVGLADEPEVPLGSELDRWVGAFAACDPDLREGTEDVAERLAATVPVMGPTAVLHGDYRLGNTLSRGHEVVSVIDWEIWSRGDARVDLAWFLMMANPDESLNRVACPGMPGDSELLATYQAARGAEVKDLTWFAALVRYKQAAAGALIARNARRRGEETTTAGGNAGLLESARRLLA